MTADPSVYCVHGLTITDRCIQCEQEAKAGKHRGFAPALEQPSSKERVHHLKCWPEFFRRVADGSKPFECRWNDRRYEVGDLLHLTEFDPDKEISTGAEVWRRVTYILPGAPGARFGINDGWVVLGLAHETAEVIPCGDVWGGSEHATCVHPAGHDGDHASGPKYIWSRDTEKTSTPQAPIAKVIVHEDDTVTASLYAPGLPPGEHDLYCEPEAVAPYMRAEKLAPDAQHAAYYRWLRDHPDATWSVSAALRGRHELVITLPFDDLDRIPASLDVAIEIARRGAEKSNSAPAAAGHHLPEPSNEGSGSSTVGADNCEHGIPRRFCTAVHAPSLEKVIDCVLSRVDEIKSTKDFEGWAKAAAFVRSVVNGEAGT